MDCGDGRGNAGQFVLAAAPVFRYDAQLSEAAAEPSPDVCQFCGKRRAEGCAWFLCAQCRAVGYCCRSHQKKGLAQHKTVCFAPPPRKPEGQRPGPAQQRPGSAVGVAAPFPLPAGGFCHLDSVTRDVQLRILACLPVPRDLGSCRASGGALRDAVEECAANVLKAPWWFLSNGGKQALEASLRFCPIFMILRVACACRSWRAVCQDRAFWRRVRLTYGWGLDCEMRGLLGCMRRVATRHGLSQLPEDPDISTEPAAPSSMSLPSSPVAGAPCKPFAAALSLERSVSCPSSNLEGPGKPVPSVSPLILCKHAELPPVSEINADNSDFYKQDHMWLLQAEEERTASDPVRRILCRYLASHSGMITGRSVLEVNAGAGLIGFYASRFAKSVTITAPSELNSRLVSFNGAMLLGSMSASKKKWSGSTKSRMLLARGIAGHVPVYIYPLPLAARGVGEFIRRWAWESGTGMRGLSQTFLAPSFDVIVCGALAGRGDGDSVVDGLLHLASALLSERGRLISSVDLPSKGHMDALARAAGDAGLVVETTDPLYDERDGFALVVVLARTPEASAPDAKQRQQGGPGAARRA